jgi:hypothetical protein
MITLSSIFDKALNQGYWILEAWETPSIFLEQFNIIYLLWHLAFDNHTSLFIVLKSSDVLLILEVGGRSWKSNGRGHSIGRGTMHSLSEQVHMQ